VRKSQERVIPFNLKKDKIVPLEIAELERGGIKMIQNNLSDRNSIIANNELYNGSKSQKSCNQAHSSLVHQNEENYNNLLNSKQLTAKGEDHTIDERKVSAKVVKPRNENFVVSVTTLNSQQSPEKSEAKNKRPNYVIDGSHLM